MELTLIMLALATFRVSVLLVDEHAPFGLAQRWRDFIGVRDGEHTSVQPNVIAGIFSCVWCMSLWVGLAFTGLYALDAELAFWVAMPLAFSAVSMIGHRVVM